MSKEVFLKTAQNLQMDTTQSWFLMSGQQGWRAGGWVFFV
jgi:hypothetical protein